MVLFGIKRWVDNTITAEEMDLIEYAHRYDHFHNQHYGYVYTGSALTGYQQYQLGIYGAVGLLY